MNPKIAALFLSLCAMAQAGLVAVPSVEVLQGPSSKTTLVGPDGSSVSSVSPGGTVVTGDQVLVPAAPAVLASVPDVVVAGPAGSVITSHTLAGPAVVPAVAPVVPAVAAAVVPAVASVVAPAAVALAGDALEGAYVPDGTEQLYDDGAYKGE